MTREDYILTRKANGDTRSIAQISEEYDATVAALSPPPPDPAALAAARKRADDVNAWLLTQKPGEAAPAEQIAAWDELRRLPFVDQAARAGL